MVPLYTFSETGDISELSCHFLWGFRKNFNLNFVRDQVVTHDAVIYDDSFSEKFIK